MSYRGRFAPSPTGPLHFGSLVAAVASWLDARAAGGEWLVRIEDVDTTRTVAGAEDAILRALEAFALTWDSAVMRQSTRTARYEEALRELRAQGETYWCKCTRKEISDAGFVGAEGTVYPGTCRDLGLSASTPGAERLRTSEAPVVFHDRVQGEIRQSVARDIGDFVLLRRDGLFAYQLAVVVDDADQGITDVVRGADLLLSTPRQILLQRRLSCPTPRYLHVPVAAWEDGLKLSKQTLAPALEPARAAESLNAALAFLGQPNVASADPAEILAAATPRWDPTRIPAVRISKVTDRYRMSENGDV